MSENTDNKVVETMVNSVTESKSNNALYLIGAGLFALATYVSVKKCYEYMKKKNDE